MASRGSGSWRKSAWGASCSPDLVTFPIYAGGPRISADRDARDAFLRLGAVFVEHGYIVRRIGCYNCRKITGGTGMSSHSWATSIDANDDTNPYRTDKLVTDMSMDMIMDVYAIETVDGVQVFRWGGDWDGRPDTKNSNYDAMHFEIIATRAEIRRGLAPPPMGVPEKPTTYPVLRLGAKGPNVLELQRLLGMTGITGTGTFGPRTDAAVKEYQKTRGLTDDGIVGAGTWTALLTGQPRIDACHLPPQKPS